MQRNNNYLPNVSIVIPAFNEERFIGETISSIINQQYENWELIIVDDQSSDKTVDLAREYSCGDDRIKIVERHREPKGAQTCRNIGIEQSKGKYIIIFDSDDIILPHCVKQRVEFIEKNSEYDFAIFKGANFDDSKKQIDKNRKWGENPNCDVLSCFLKARYPFGIWNCIFKSEIVKNIFFDENIKVYQDFDYIIRVLLADYKYVFDDFSEIDYLYRQGHTGTITSNFITGGKYDSTKYLFDKTLKEIQQLSDYKEKKEVFFNFFKLQLQKVALSGSQEQIKDFTKYIREIYGFPHSIKAFIFFIMLKGPLFNNVRYRRKYVHLLYSILYSPREIIDYLKNKVNRTN